MLRFTTTGKPFARGEQQGLACRQLILPWFHSRLQNPATPAWSRIEPCVERCARVSPEAIEESRGIARGLGMAESDYFRVTFGFLCELPQCTTCGLRSDRGGVFIAKTDDLFGDETGKNVLEFTVPDGGYRHVHFHFGGTVWTVAGMNEHGLAIAMTGIPGPVLDQDGMPCLVGLHTILPCCATVEEAIHHVESLRINSYGFSLQIGDAKGNLALVEKTGVGTVVMRGHDSEPLLHTNHILDARFAEANPPQKEPILTNGRRRLETATRLLHNLPRTEAGMTGFLCDRSPVGAICQQGEDGMFTDFAVIFVPTEKRFTFWPGPPSSTVPEQIDMAKEFA